jgi:hypothetical protein
VGKARRARRRDGGQGVGGALERCRADFQPVNPTLTVNFSTNLNCATKMLDTKLADETSLYNICKGCPMIFLNGLSRNAKQSSGSAER